eukprot:m.41343 g.41343  ORF g.41343 m.41343 type:complete len:295 (-) comp8200_c0_seq2:1843-2727(-)
MQTANRIPPTKQPSSTHRSRIPKLARQLGLGVPQVSGVSSVNVGWRTALAIALIACSGFWAGGRHVAQQERALERLGKARQQVIDATHRRDAAASALEKARELVLDSQANLLKVHSQALNAPPTGEQDAIALPAIDTAPATTRLCAPPGLQSRGGDDLPILVFICGVEGSGHHAMEAVLDDLSKKVDLVYTGYNPGFHSFAKHPDVSRAYQFSNVSLATYEATMRRHLQGRKLKGRPLIFDSRNSCVSCCRDIALSLLWQPNLRPLLQIPRRVWLRQPRPPRSGVPCSTRRRSL